MRARDRGPLSKLSASNTKADHMSGRPKITIRRYGVDNSGRNCVECSASNEAGRTVYISPRKTRIDQPDPVELAKQWAAAHGYAVDKII